MTSQRILHFIESEGVYGAERVILNLSRQMRINHTYTPIVGCIVNNAHDHSDLYEAAIAEGIEAVKIPISNKYVFLHLPRAAKQFRNLNINLIHSHGYKPSVYSFIIRLLTGISILSTCHLWFDPSNAVLKTRVMIRLEKFFYRWYPKIVGVSEPILDVLRQSNIDDKKLVLIRNGVDIPPIPSTNDLQRLRDELKVSPQDFCVINCARLSRQKDQMTLLAATKILKEKNIPIKTWIVGQGPLEAELRQQIKAMDLEDQVHLLGFRDDIPLLLGLANVFALPSLDEGMPMSLLEAAACAKPIVTTLVGDIGKLIKDRETGLVIPVGKATDLAMAIAELYDNPTLAISLAQNAHRAMVDNYSSAAMHQQYSQVYSELLKGK